MPVSPSRAAAFDILLRVERENSYASELLHSTAYDKLSRPDHALATELVMGVLRWRSRLDDEIAGAVSQPLKKLDLEVLTAIRLAVYQFRFLDRIPQRAALHESVELVRRARKRSAAPFVNAVLRRLASAPVRPVVKDSSRQAIAESYAHPLWMVKRWTEQYSLEVTEKICEHNQSIPQTTLRLRSPKAEAELDAQGISLAPGEMLASARRLISGDVTKSESFRTGRVVIQDEASQLVATLIGPGHEQILDCCAAPGGKTLAVADQNPGAAITAVEIHPHRARLMRTLFRKDAQRIRIVTADARHLPLQGTFDRILVDAPCSGTGTLARNPEIKWRLEPQDLPELHERQLAILRSAAERLKPGGSLIYSTCSLEKEENEDVVERFLKDDPRLRQRDCREELDHLKATGVLNRPDPIALTRGPNLRTIPGIHPGDGFFAA